MYKLSICLEICFKELPHAVVGLAYPKSAGQIAGRNSCCSVGAEFLIWKILV